MIKKTSLAVLLIALLLSACSATEVAEPVLVVPDNEILEPTSVEAVDPLSTPELQLEFVDDLGHTIMLNGYAQAIVALGPSSLESLFAIGAGEQIVGREEYSAYPVEAINIASVGDLFSAFPLENIVALEPDLVIAPQIIAQESVEALMELGVTVFWMENPVDFAGLFDQLSLLAQMTGHQEEADLLVESLAARVSAVEDIVAYVEETPSVLYELDATDPINPWTVGPGTFIDTLINMAGGTNAASVLSSDYAQISSEAVIEVNPQVILLADAPYGITPESVSARAGWQVISAVENDRVYAFDPLIVSVPGPRMVLGLETMAALLHPESFE
jgi:iron complex transport system substrate-binding protein